MVFMLLSTFLMGAAHFLPVKYGQYIEIERADTPLSIAIYASILRGLATPLSMVNTFSIAGPPKYCNNRFDISHILIPTS